MITLEELKKKIIEKQIRCYRCGRVHDYKIDQPVFLYHLTKQNYELISNPVNHDLTNIIALCDVCHYTIKSRVI